METGDYCSASGHALSDFGDLTIPWDVSFFSNTADTRSRRLPTRSGRTVSYTYNSAGYLATYTNDLGGVTAVIHTIRRVELSKS